MKENKNATHVMYLNRRKGRNALILAQWMKPCIEYVCEKKEYKRNQNHWLTDEE